MNDKAAVLLQWSCEQLIRKSPDMKCLLKVSQPGLKHIRGSQLLGDKTKSGLLLLIGRTQPTYLCTCIVQRLDQRIVVDAVAGDY